MSGLVCSWVPHDRQTEIRQATLLRFNDAGFSGPRNLIPVASERFFWYGLKGLGAISAERRTFHSRRSISRVGCSVKPTMGISRRAESEHPSHVLVAFLRVYTLQPLSLPPLLARPVTQSHST